MASLDDFTQLAVTAAKKRFNEDYEGQGYWDNPYSRTSNPDMHLYNRTDYERINDLSDNLNATTRRGGYTENQDVGLLRDLLSGLQTQQVAELPRPEFAPEGQDVIKDVVGTRLLPQYLKSHGIPEVESQVAPNIIAAMFQPSMTNRYIGSRNPDSQQETLEQVLLDYFGNGKYNDY